ncbi:MAG: VTT domain-containing protein [Candidatus Heimdallarchaeota archaeon]
MVLQSLFAPIPSELILLAGGIIFGVVWGSIVGLVGSMLSAAVTFYISKRGGRSIIDATGEKVVLTPRGKEYTAKRAFEDFKTSSNWAILNAKRLEAIAKTSKSKKALEEQAKLKEAIELMEKARKIILA